MATLEERYPLRHGELGELLSTIRTTPDGVPDDSCIVVHGGRLSKNRLTYWRSRVSVFTAKHLREYRVRYLPQLGLTVMLCTCDGVRINGELRGSDAEWVTGPRGGLSRQ